MSVFWEHRIYTPPFFNYPVARVVRSIVAISIGANNIPTSLGQYWNWCREWLPARPRIHAFSLAAVCWAI